MPVLSVAETQQVDITGELHDFYEITYQVGGHPGSFTFLVPKTGDVLADAQAARDALVSTVNGLYGL